MSNDVVANALDNKITKWFVRGLTGIILGSYTFFIVQTKIILREDLNFHGDDWWVIGGSLAIWIAFEAVRAYLKRKAESA